MSAPVLFVTANGPGEVMGWTRPFLRQVYEAQPQARVTVVVLPCAYATGKETELLQTMFPAARVIDPKAYGRFLVGRHVAGLERTSGVLQYLGGDLFHAATIARRLGLRAMTYKFSKRSYAKLFERFFALDERNAQELRAMGAPPDRVRVVGNLVADAVVGSLQEPPPPPGTGSGVCILPGSRPYELRFLMPFFMAVARELVRLRPGRAVTFVVSPFNSDDELRAAVQWAGDPQHFGIAGRFDAADSAIEVEGVRFAVDRSHDYGALAQSQLVISIPGTKCMEAAVLGRALLVAVPFNRVDEVALNGVAAYLHRVPLVGRPLKRWIALKIAQRIEMFAQPNIDAGRFVAPEMRGILKPEAVALKAAELLDDPHELRLMGETLAALYASDVGAAQRMAGEVLGVAAKAAPASVAV
jgi:lipid A disaccharide synthetase